MFSQAKGSKANAAVEMDAECMKKAKAYLGISKKEKEPLSYFRVVNYLAITDSAGYFDFLEGMPLQYQSFFKGLYLVQQNNFSAALQVFDILIGKGIQDSLLLTETTFWRDAAEKLLNDKAEYDILVQLYKELEKPERKSYPRIAEALSKIVSPEYLFHKYLVQYNYNYRIGNYQAAKEVYDSVLKYTPHSKMKTSLAQKREYIMEMLLAKQKFIDVSKNHLYYYNLADLYEHLKDWSKDTVTNKKKLEAAAFRLQAKHSNHQDSVYTRWLIDTLDNESKNKFEVLSFTRVPWEREGKRVVMVKLAFSDENTYNFYLPQLSSFQSKPMYGSLFFTNKGQLNGREYMLTRHFIAALYEQNDPFTKYALSLYCIEDNQGNLYAIDTLF